MRNSKRLKNYKNKKNFKNRRSEFNKSLIDALVDVEDDPCSPIIPCMKSKNYSKKIGEKGRKIRYKNIKELVLYEVALYSNGNIYK